MLTGRIPEQDSLTAENAKLRAEVEYIKTDDPTWFERMDRLEAERDALRFDLARVTAEREGLVKAAESVLAGDARPGIVFLPSLEQWNALQAAVSAVKP